MYVNFMILVLKGQHLEKNYIKYLSMFGTIHINVKVFPILAPSIKKICKGLEGYLCFLCIISFIMHLCSSLHFFIFVENSSYGIHSSIC